MKGKIFNAQEVQAILNGSKVMFREVIKPQPAEGFYPRRRNNKAGNDVWMEFKDTPKSDRIWGGGFDRWKSPYQLGQKIFCKESFSFSQYSGDNSVRYWASGDSELAGWTKPKPAQHMKQEHSRLTLRIKSVKVERLQDISEKDAFKSGYFTIPNREAGESYVSKFKEFWNSTHKKPEEKFEANPWVFVYTMEAVK